MGNLAKIAFIAAALVIGLVLIQTTPFGARYHVASTPQGSLYKVDLWTGAVTICYPNHCYRLDEYAAPPLER